jgi:hypothetical protein
MELHDVLDDREAQAGPARLARARPVDPVKPLREARDVSRRDAFAGVADRQLDPFARLLARQIGATRGAHFDRHAAVAWSPGRRRRPSDGHSGQRCCSRSAAVICHSFVDMSARLRRISAYFALVRKRRLP